MPGMRALADLVCPGCSARFYGDLPCGQGLYTPQLLDAATGEVFDRFGVPWFARWLRDSFADRRTDDLDFTVEEFRPVVRPLLLNCLDKLYGHALLKLFNAQHYLDHHPDHDVVLLLPRYLRWLAPRGVAAVWSVDLPLRRGAEWNDRLADEIARRVAPFASCMLSVALPHPHAEDVDIERFTGVAPCDEERWAQVAHEPTVTFVWRDDRTWGGQGGGLRRLADRLAGGAGRAADRVAAQRERVVALAATLRRSAPALRFVVAGPGTPGDLPEHIVDDRTPAIDEAVERRWCSLYAASHVVVGIHGSNMLLPSAHAGAVVELVPADRWGNVMQDLMTASHDAREALLAVRLVPDSADPETVALIVGSLLTYRNAMMLNLGRANSLHSAARIDSFAERRLALARARREEAG